ncbi:RidA family protein [bacterium]|nr:RidA family protein [bacterium]
MHKQTYSSGAPWEASAGYSRAVRVGNWIFTAGTLAADEKGVIHGVDCYAQCCYIFRKLERALAELGAGLGDVVKVRAYLVNMADSEGFMKAHSEFLGSTRPAATCVVVKELFAAEALVEIELTAIQHQALN